MACKACEIKQRSNTQEEKRKKQLKHESKNKAKLFGTLLPIFSLSSHNNLHTHIHTQPTERKEREKPCTTTKKKEKNLDSQKATTTTTTPTTPTKPMMRTCVLMDIRETSVPARHFTANNKTVSQLQNNTHPFSNQFAGEKISPFFFKFFFSFLLLLLLSISKWLA